MKNYDYKAKMNQNRKRFIKRVAGLTVATTLVVGAPVATSVLSNETLQDTFGVTVAHAAADNLMEADDQARVAPYYNDEYNYTRYVLYNGSNPILNLDDFDALTYIVKLPDELSYILEDEFFLNNLVHGQNNNNGDFMVTGTVTDKNGEPFSISRNEHRPADFVTVNQATNSIEFDFHSFLVENELTSVAFFSFDVPIYQEGHFPIANAEYGFKAALVASESVDLDSVGGAEQITFTAEQSDEDADTGDGDDNAGDGDDQDGDDNAGDGDDQDGDDNAGDGDDQDGDDNTGDGDDQDGDDNAGDGDDQDGDDNAGDADDQDGDDNAGDGNDQDGDDNAGDGNDQDGDDNAGDGDDQDGDDNAGDGDDQDGDDNAGDGDDQDGDDNAGDGDDQDGDDNAGDGDDQDGDDNTGDGNDQDGDDNAGDGNDQDGDDNTGDGNDQDGDDNTGDDNDRDGDDNNSGSKNENDPKESEEDNVIEINDKSDTGDSNGELNNDTSKEEGEKLPDTATNTWTYGLAGAVALLLGVATKIVGRFKRSV